MAVNLLPPEQRILDCLDLCDEEALREVATMTGISLNQLEASVVFGDLDGFAAEEIDQLLSYFGQHQ